MRKPNLALINQPFGQLVVQAYDGGGWWLCQCACGNTTRQRSTALTKGAVTSCGCSRGRHGYAKHRDRKPEYNVWAMMIQRCTNPNYNRFADYGGRGIQVDPRWLGPEGFVNFLADVGSRPSSAHQLERKDNSGNYGPDNCVWATRSEQQRNRRNNVCLTINGETRVLKDWADHFNVPYSTLLYRLKHWGAERTLQSLTSLKEASSHGTCYHL